MTTGLLVQSQRCFLFSVLNCNNFLKQRKCPCAASIRNSKVLKADIMWSDSLSIYFFFDYSWIKF